MASATDPTIGQPLIFQPRLKTPRETADPALTLVTIPFLRLSKITGTPTTIEKEQFGQSVDQLGRVGVGRVCGRSLTDGWLERSEVALAVSDRRVGEGLDAPVADGDTLGQEDELGEHLLQEKERRHSARSVTRRE